MAFLSEQQAPTLQEDNDHIVLLIRTIPTSVYFGNGFPGNSQQCSGQLHNPVFEILVE